MLARFCPIVVAVVMAMANVSSSLAAEPEWRPLFDGKTLEGWKQRGGAAKYRVEDAQIVGTAVPNTGNSFLCTDRDYGDFVLELEFKVDPRLNSGIQIRSECFDEPKEIEHNGKKIRIPAGRVHGYQVEIDPSDRAWSAGIYDEGRRGWLNDLKGNEAARKAFRQNDWNKVRVECRGDSIKTWLNDVSAADLKDGMTPKGFISLQVHGVGGKTEPMEVRWRNIRIQDLDAAPAKDKQSSVGRRIESFALPDVHGQTRRLADLGEQKLVVVAFLGTECPLAKLYAPRLQELSREYASRGVAFVAIDANTQDSLSEMAAFARTSGIDFPFLKDRDQAVADQFAAQRNPIAYVLDHERVIRYAGRIDDQYGLGASTGYARPQVKRRDLGTALDELLAGNAVSQATTPVTGCIIGRTPRVAAHGEVTYSQHIAKILQDHCVSCHRPGEIGPFALTDYDEVVGWAPMLREVVADGRMPPWSASPEFGHFSNDPRLSDAEKALLATWIDNGCPAGDPQHLPAQRQWADGWQIDKPDQVIRMSKAFKVPADGTVPYQYFLLDPGWNEDKWIRAAEVRPGNRAVVHHILVSFLPRGRLPDPRKVDSDVINLTSYVPGSVPHVYGPGVAVFVPAKSRIVMNIHYTPSGVAQEDQTSLGVVFADPATVKKQVQWDIAENRTFKILPRLRDQEFLATYEFKSDQLLLSMSPHMHLRGQSFRYDAQYPDGTHETLLDVPRYDFNWQLRYDLTEAKRMPSGTKLVCRGEFDNSEDNLANPDPGATVTFGWETFEEMCTGFFTSVPIDDNGPAGARASAK